MFLHDVHIQLGVSNDIQLKYVYVNISEFAFQTLIPQLYNGMHSIPKE